MARTDEIRRRTCQACGALLDDAAEFHPYVFCVLKRVGRDPWADFRFVAQELGLGPVPEKPPQVRHLPIGRRQTR